VTEFLGVGGGEIAYDVSGEGPLVILSHGMGDIRQAYRFLAPKLVQAGYRVAVVDMRGHGESSTGWTSITRTDVGRDLLALIRHLGGPAVIVGHSLSGGAATVAAALEPGMVRGIIGINPFTRVQRADMAAMIRIRRYRLGMSRLMLAQVFKSVRVWMLYLKVAYPGKPDDYDSYMAGLTSKLHEPDRMAQFILSTRTTPADADAQLPHVQCPALIIMGDLDPDFANPKAEGDAIAAAMRPGLGTVAVVGGAGHYPHAQSPDQVAALITPFLKSLR
jgi:pimeloyl-ACP methyl ester carboxylesterase